MLVRSLPGDLRPSDSLSLQATCSMPFKSSARTGGWRKASFFREKRLCVKCLYPPTLTAFAQALYSACPKLPRDPQMLTVDEESTACAARASVSQSSTFHENDNPPASPITNSKHRAACRKILTWFEKTLLCKPGFRLKGLDLRSLR